MSNRLYVGNLPYSTTNDILRDTFAPFGEVVSATIVLDRETGRSRGFGFVEMATSEQATKAAEEMNGHPFEGRPLVVNEAREKGAGGGGGGGPRGGFGGGGGRREGGFGGGGGGFGGGGGRREGGGFGGGGGGGGGFGGGGGRREGGFGGGGGRREGGFGGGGGRREGGFGGGGGGGGRRGRDSWGDDSGY